MDFSFLLRKFIYPLLSFLQTVALSLLVIGLALVLYMLIKYRVNPFRMNRAKLVAMPIRLKLMSFLRWKVVDIMDAPSQKGTFREFGLTLYCGRQGSGKTISMVHYLARMRTLYPDCIIVTNFSCAFSDYKMESWSDFFKYRNGEQGVIFAIDEIHSEYSASSWKDFPESLLSEISQQRKQRVKIVASSQVYSRVVKQIREQSVSVVQCSTVAGRWTRNVEYDSREYEACCDNPQNKLKPIRKGSFIQSDDIRNWYDTYEKVESMREKEFIPRHERGGA